MIKILGIGSPFSNDQLGWLVSDLLLQKNALKTLIPQQLIIEKYDRPGLRLVNLIKDAEMVLLIDAIKSIDEKVMICKFSVEEIIDAKIFSISSHGMGLVQALQMAKILGTLPDKVIIYGIAINHFAKDNDISEEVSQTCYKLANDITKFIIHLRNNL